MITEKLVVKTPTQEEYNKVVQCMLDNGNEWNNGDKLLCNEMWKDNEENTCISLGYFEDNKITFCDGYDMKNRGTQYTSQEFLNKYGYWGVRIDVDENYEENNKHNKSIMTNIIKFAKELVLSKEEKLLRKQGLKNDCGDYTDTAREIVMQKLLSENETYLVGIAEAKEKEEKE